MAWNTDTDASGGYSSLFPRPSYHDGLAQAYATRGVPDVVTNADSSTAMAQAYSNGEPRSDASTSAAAPLWAGVDRPVRMRAERLLSQQLEPSSGANVIAADLCKAQGARRTHFPGAWPAPHLPRPGPVTTRTGRIGPAQLAAMRYARPPTVCCQSPASEARPQCLHGQAGDGSRYEARAQSECPRRILPTAHNWRICCGRRDQSIGSARVQSRRSGWIRYRRADGVSHVL